MLPLFLAASIAKAVSSASAATDPWVMPRPGMDPAAGPGPSADPGVNTAQDEAGRQLLSGPLPLVWARSDFPFTKPLGAQVGALAGSCTTPTERRVPP